MRYMRDMVFQTQLTKIEAIYTLQATRTPGSQNRCGKVTRADLIVEVTSGELLPKTVAASVRSSGRRIT